MLVEDIPASVCGRCREATISREITERIRGMVHREGKPVRGETVDVFEYARGPGFLADDPREAPRPVKEHIIRAGHQGYDYDCD